MWELSRLVIVHHSQQQLASTWNLPPLHSDRPANYMSSCQARLISPRFEQHHTFRKQIAPGGEDEAALRKIMGNYGR